MYVGRNHVKGHAGALRLRPGRFIVVPLTGRRGRLHGRPVNEPAQRHHD
jgi:hypothetical protein